MKFKDIKETIHSDCRVKKGYVETSVCVYEKTPFDEDEVIGIRSRGGFINFKVETYVEVLVK